MNSFQDIEPRRIRHTQFSSNTGDTFGAFMLSFNDKTLIQCIACDGLETGWDHVSATTYYRTKKGKMKNRIPTWDEMCFVKDAFFSRDETVVQFHPAASEYINNHKNVLHLWKSTKTTFPTPPKELV